MGQVVIPDYIVSNLKRYGNAAVGKSTFPSRTSDEAILKALERFNLNCRVVYTNWDVLNTAMVKSRKRTKDITKTIHVIKA